MTAAEQRPDEERPAWVPDFPGQRPPFQPGHTLSMKHGAWSARKLQPIAAELVNQLLADDTVAYLRAPRYATAVHAWATIEARVALLSGWVDGMTTETAVTAPGAGQSPPIEVLRKWEATAQAHRSRLGLDPVSAARLGKDVAQGRAADAAAELTRMREQHERATREAADDD